MTEQYEDLSVGLAGKIVEKYIRGTTLLVYDTYPDFTLGSELSSLMWGRLRPYPYLFDESPVDHATSERGYEAGEELRYLAESHGLTTFDRLLRLTQDEMREQLGDNREATKRVVKDIGRYLLEVRRNGLPEKTLLPLPYETFRTNAGFAGNCEQTGAIAHEDGLRGVVQLRIGQTTQMGQVEKAIFILHHGLTEKTKSDLEIAGRLELPTEAVRRVIEAGLPKDLVNSLEVFTPPYTDSLAGRIIPHDYPRPGQLLRKLVRMLEDQFPNAARDLSLPEDFVTRNDSESFDALERATYEVLALELT